jgi:hypothetical protein
MKKVLMLAVVCVLFSGASALLANDDKKVTVTGDGMCAKCALKETTSCQNAVIEDKDGKKTTYYLVHEGVSKKSHGSMGFCKASKESPVKVKVTGTVEEKDGKKELTAETIEKVE